MLAGTFQRRIRLLNSRLRFIASADESKPVGLYWVTDTDRVHICGTDRNFVPEFTEFDGRGHILKGGWRRAVEILIHSGLVSKTKADRMFGTVFDRRRRVAVPYEDRIQAAIRQLSSQTKTGIEMKRDDIIGVGKEIKKVREGA